MKIGGAVDAEFEFAAGQLFTKCKTTVHANVHTDRDWQDSETETIEIKSEKEVGGCKQLRFTYEKRRRKVKFEGEVAIRVVCKDDHTKKEVASYCNFKPFKSEGVGYDEARSTWEFVKRVCNCDKLEKDTPLGPSPDQDNGK